MPENSCPGIALDRVAIRIMTGGIPELLCRSPSSGVDLNQDFSRLRFWYTQAITPAKHATQAAVVSLVFSGGENGGSFFAGQETAAT
jgi:hypothetical protein